MKILLLGDIHGKWERVNSIIDHELTKDDLALCVGDLCNYKYNNSKGTPFYFIWGNHESMIAVENLLGHKSQLRPIQAAHIINYNGINITGLPGVYSSRFTPEPQKGIKGVRKYFSFDDLENFKKIGNKIDIFLTHEAPKGCNFIKFNQDLGKDLVTSVLDTIKPKFAFVGHHHMHVESHYADTKIYGLHYPKKEYMLIDTKDWSTKLIQTTFNEERKRYEYDWER